MRFAVVKSYLLTLLGSLSAVAALAVTCWLFVHVLVSCAVAQTAPALTIKRMYSADYCGPCAVLRRDLAANGANITIIPRKSLPKRIVEIPTVVYDDGTTDTGTKARRLPRSAFKKAIPDYELVTR